jgi:hypothetical protein
MINIFTSDIPSLAGWAELIRPAQVLKISNDIAQFVEGGIVQGTVQVNASRLYESETICFSTAQNP